MLEDELEKLVIKYKIDDKKVSDVKEISGKGVQAFIGGRRVCVGNDKLMENTTYNQGYKIK